MSNITVCSVSSNALAYLRFQDSVCRTIASDKAFHRLIAVTTDSTDVAAVYQLPNTDHFMVDMQSRKQGDAHGYGINLLMEKVKTEYALLIDPDAVLLLPNWDQLLIRELANSCILIGTPYDPNRGRMRYQNLPNAVCMFFKVESLKGMAIDWRPLDYRWRRFLRSLLLRLPVQYRTLDFETGWRLPFVFKRFDYDAKCFEFIQPENPKALLRRPEDSFEEYHWKGQPIVTHLKGSSKHPFETSKHAQHWKNTIVDYLFSQQIQLPEDVLEL